MDGPWVSRTELQALQDAEPALDRAMYLGQRFFIRTLRLFAGLIVMALGMYVWGATPNILSMPLGAMTLGQLLGGIAGYPFAMWIWYLAIIAAFGRGPEPLERFRNRAIQTAAQAEAQLRQNT